MHYSPARRSVLIGSAASTTLLLPSRSRMMIGSAASAALLPASAQPQAVAHRPAPGGPLTDPADDAARLKFATSLLGTGQRVVRRRITIRGVSMDYDTTVGAIELKDDKGEPSAIFVFTAYTRPDAGDPGRRPVTFAWGGGPSGPSTSFHFGVLGPRMSTEGPDATLADNPDSILDRTDLVMVDPVGTGWSVPAGAYQLWDFYSVAKDGASVAQFIRCYLQETGRPHAPIYLTGRSYGTLRLPTVVHFLRLSDTPVTGVFPVAAAMDGNAFWEGSGNMTAFYLMLPNYAAVAWYHKRQARPAATVEEAVKEAGEFALNDYLTTLMAWPHVAPTKRKSTLDRLHALTGISQDVWMKHRLRINGGLFAREFLRDQGMVVRASDGRIAVPVQGSDRPAGPPSPGESIMNIYARTELGLEGTPPYRGLAPGIYNEAITAAGPHPWDMTDHRAFHDVDGFLVPCYPNYLDDLAEAMQANPTMRIQQHSGMYDLTCSSFPANWSVSNINVPDELRGNIQLFDYASGHAVYGDAPTERTRFIRNVAAFYRT